MGSKDLTRQYIGNFQDYQDLYKKSIDKPDEFWADKARELLDWYRDFHTTHIGSFAGGDNAWFVEGQLNASYNCVDRHAMVEPEKVAIIYESDEPGKGRKITYQALLQDVCRLSYVLRDMGISRGDTVAIYLPNIPEALVAMLACSRIGALHSVVFMGFSASALKDRILDARARVVITSDEAQRGGKIIHTKIIVNEALLQCPGVSSCLVLKHTGSDVPWSSARDVWWHEEVSRWPAYFPPEPMSAEAPLFLLYTSGSTGKPKGLMHTTAGYLLGAAVSTKLTFNMYRSDVFFCAGDVGWITGHTYLVYGPLLLGSTTIVYEGTPSYPSFSRFWDIVDQHDVTHFYAAPTALRLLKRAGPSYITAPMKALRVLGSIGEPIAPEVWNWYHSTVGRGRACVVDVCQLARCRCVMMTSMLMAR